LQRQCVASYNPYLWRSFKELADMNIQGTMFCTSTMRCMVHYNELAYSTWPPSAASPSS
jgi:hypothetical protein